VKAFGGAKNWRNSIHFPSIHRADGIPEFVVLELVEFVFVCNFHASKVRMLCVFIFFWGSFRNIFFVGRFFHDLRSFLLAAQNRKLDFCTKKQSDLRIYAHDSHDS